jgi:hypothetical protein
MSDPKLPSFKAKDLQKQAQQRAPSAQPSSKKQNNAEHQTLGFARIEAMLDDEDPKEVLEGLMKIVERLNSYEAACSKPKEKAAAQKARKGLERGIAIVEYLYDVKIKMIESSKKDTP